ncbi:hypothetical protein AVEN_249546-1 [Araneus ventricosus]|uniref:Reverse transcriptase domain-containing protein n=1 Tax=Araneus ventricosus TaxID=182803 RepID=A0A4Y2KKK4_ARAVE|nr:hypothetical protein AVEN_249546-1 [Araneus ventricosus]
MLATSLLIKEASIIDLWNLEVIGITDSATKISKEEEDLKAKSNYLKRISINDEGRYEVVLPWKEDHMPLSSHKDLALKRLQNIKLKSGNLYQVHDNVLKEWSELGIIKEVPPDDVTNFEHYLLHRPMIKQNGSTKVRPVFAFSREKSIPSSNQRLNCGPNLIKCIPSLLLILRERKYGVSADIEKVFLQISVRKSNRDYLHFFMVDRKRTVTGLSSHKGSFRCSQQPFFTGISSEIPP